jgi:hypothetical protein
MTKAQMIKSALYAINKHLTYEKLYYSDEMYGHEKETEKVWEFVQECEEIGTIAFKEKYKQEISQ